MQSSKHKIPIQEYIGQMYRRPRSDVNVVETVVHQRVLINEVNKQGEMCPCGSGRKTKNCHGKKRSRR